MELNQIGTDFILRIIGSILIQFECLIVISVIRGCGTPPGRNDTVSLLTAVLIIVALIILLLIIALIVAGLILLFAFLFF